MQKLEIIGIPPTLNELKRMHFYEQSTSKKAWERVVNVLVREQKLKKVTPPVVITYRFHFRDKRRRDPDGYAYSAKSIQDALVRSGILPDDNFTVVKEIRIAKGENRPISGITVEIEEVSA